MHILSADQLGYTWTPVISFPTARTYASMAFDSQTNKIVLFGGVGGSGLLGDTWVFDASTNTWTNLEISGPSARFDASMAFDSQTNKIVLFGGAGDSGGLGDTWVFDASTNTWTNLEIPGPSARFDASMAFDSQTNKIILFGGEDNNGALGDTWVFDASTNTWTNLEISGPSARFDASMAFDSQTNKIVLFGGVDDYGGLGDTWVFDASTNTWTNLEISGDSPSARGGASMAFDSQTNQIVLFGGGVGGVLLDDTWVFDASTNTWTNLEISGPSARGDASMAFDSQTNQIILFGGGGASGKLGDTWIFNASANTWTNLISSPSARDGASMAFDSQTNKIVLFGGEDNNSYFDDTWVFDASTNTWTNLEISGHSPPARAYASMAFDSQTNTIVLFGGVGASGLLGDTWIFDLIANTWTQPIILSYSPSARDGVSMAFDPQTSTVVLFGGFDIYGPLGDTWIFNASENNWTNPVISGDSPSSRGGVSMAFDSQINKIVLFGGEVDNGYVGDTWVFDASTNTWTNLEISGDFPSARAYASMAFDSQTNQIILFGGEDNDEFGDTWVFDARANTWTNLEISGPSARSGASMAYDSQVSKIVLFGGYDQYNEFGDTWTFLPLLNPHPPSNLSGVQKKNDFGTCYELFSALTWNASLSDIAGYFVYRDGILIATLGPTTFQYSDHNNAKGKKITYSVTAFNSSGAQSDPVSITIP